MTREDSLRVLVGCLLCRLMTAGVNPMTSLASCFGFLTVGRSPAVLFQAGT